MNLPNRITIFRIVLIPIILLVWLFPYEQFGINFIYVNIGPTGFSLLNLIVLGLFCLASITDMLDGKIARKRKLITTFGKFADPVADKLLVNSFFIVMLYKHMVPVVPVIAMIFRDTIVDGCRMVASSKGKVVAAGVLGKLKTVLQMITIIFLLINNIPFEFVSFPMTTLLVWFTAFVSVASGYSYYVQLKPYIFESKWGIWRFICINILGGIYGKRKRCCWN